MTIQKDLKRVVRARMRKTGESYTAARRQVTTKRSAAGAPAPPDLAALAGMKDEVVKQRTGRTWQQWASVLDKAGAADWEHRRIARHVSDLGVPAWWCQAVTVGYERIRGLRAIGQKRNGTWEAGRSRTFPLPVETLYPMFAVAARRKAWLPVHDLKIRTSRKNRSIRLPWTDGTSVEWAFTPKGTKCQVTVAHTKLKSKAEQDRMKVFWGERLDALTELLRKQR